MSVHFADDHLTVHVGDVRDVLPTLPAASVHCVVTSPPYWGLRDYGTATWEGGDPECQHSVGGQVQDSKWAGAITTGQRPGVDASRCRLCGACRVDGQLGLEPTPEEYVTNLVGVFREVRRVLRDDGTVWLNLGDSYGATTKHGGLSESTGLRPYATKFGKAIDEDAKGTRLVRPGVKPKDLVGIPWRVAFALQADGWYLRSDIIWAKPNPMPESVTDRPTKAHEYVFLLSKSARYFFDADAVREGFADERMGNPGTNGVRKYAPGDRQDVGRPMAWTKGAEQGGRNIRTVWTIATEPYPGAHFATFPRKLVEPCVKAGTSERGVCPECGAPWEREVETHRGPTPKERGGKNYGATAQGTSESSALRKVGGDDWYAYAGSTETTGWRPSCAHAALRPVPATVLDPFAGSGTTGFVANALGRRAVLIDLNADYIDQAMKRNAQAPLGIGA